MNTAKLISLTFASLFLTNAFAEPMLCPSISNTTPPPGWDVLNIPTGEKLIPQPANIQLNSFSGAAYSEQYTYNGECLYKSADNKYILLGNNDISKPVVDPTNAWKWKNNVAICKTTDLTACIFGSS